MATATFTIMIIAIVFTASFFGLIIAVTKHYSILRWEKWVLAITGIISAFFCLAGIVFITLLRLDAVQIKEPPSTTIQIKNQK